jgi:hypothetical protein
MPKPRLLARIKQTTDLDFQEELFPKLSRREGRKRRAFNNAKTAPSTMNIIRNGSEMSHTIGAAIKQKSATGHETTRRKHQPKNQKSTFIARN